MPELNAKIRDIELPRRMRKLPISDKGFPVPWFVALIDGTWDFRVIGPRKTVDALQKRLCWLCGEPLGRVGVFVSGPMCTVNRTSAEPPSHRDCAVYAARACPFLANPRMRRNDNDLPEHRDVAGIQIERNPGVTAVWATRVWKPFQAGRGGILIRMGDPEQVDWFAEGRAATHAEVMHSMDTGMVALFAIAAEDGPDDVEMLQGMYEAALHHIPKE